MAVNFHSAFHCCQSAVRRMTGRDGVRKIVNISSNGAYNFDVFDPPHYRASKAAMDTLTKDLARRYARDRIAVNSLAPAMTETPLFDVLTEDVLARAIAAMPHGAAMKPAEIALFSAFLTTADSYFEYGMGGSTFLASQHVRKRVAAIDSDPGWVANVRKAIGETTKEIVLSHVDIGATGEQIEPTG